MPLRAENGALMQKENDQYSKIETRVRVMRFAICHPPTYGQDSIYNEATMKAKHVFGIVVVLLGLLILILSLANFNPPAAFALSSDASQTGQSTPTHALQEGDDSEIGSTDGIVVMGMVIVLIVTLPLALNKKR